MKHKIGDTIYFVDSDLNICRTRVTLIVKDDNGTHYGNNHHGILKKESEIFPDVLSCLSFVRELYVLKKTKLEVELKNISSLLVGDNLKYAKEVLDKYYS